jgi:hypothetical protein
MYEMLTSILSRFTGVFECLNIYVYISEYYKHFQLLYLPIIIQD